MNVSQPAAKPRQRDHTPLADRMRPQSLDEALGQEHLTGSRAILRQALESGRIPSVILWGPPGSGKTTLARIMAHGSGRRFASLSAVLSGVKELRAVSEQARRESREGASGTLLFVDEIHRFNKSQQDAFLPFVEEGSITLIGATTENPSFELNGALLSRCRVLTLNRLEAAQIVTLLERAAEDEVRGLGALGVTWDPAVLVRIAEQADGDARHALNTLETLAHLAGEQAAREKRPLSDDDLTDDHLRRSALYDKAGEAHYDLISALHKSLRGSDADAALYWLARMLEGGESGLYVARRMIRFASEDIGNADPQALTVAMHGRDAYHFLGSPEGDLSLAQVAVYLACAPKSNRLYSAFKAARKAARKQGSLPPPLHSRNAPTELMKELGYSAGYRYDHDSPEGYAAQDHLPEKLQGTRFYEPVARGFEREIIRRLAYWRRLRKRHDGERS
ncbi:MAG: replication-associated recombination protein A [Magnetococcales bacterium]|nr:replication-associated recombination protein A [Magnetococcales bacterium]